MRRKSFTMEDAISKYREYYIDKGRLSPEEKERFLYWISLNKINEEIKSMKPFVMGGYPRMMYNSITPYYQWIVVIFVSLGVIFSILSIGGFFISNLAFWISYFIPGIVAIIFGIILLFFIKSVKK
jgi:hypothetical protein